MPPMQGTDLQRCSRNCHHLSDILVGTHKLLGKAVKWHDIGLLIIDEEQKFGVSTKEKLRQLKTNIDTLTMSATPIPRTLQFSLMGARDMSIMRGIRSYLAIGYSNVGWMNGIALESLRTFKCAIEHYVAVA